MHDPYLKRSQPHVSFYMVCEQPAVDAGLVRSCCDKQEVRCRACFNLSCLRYGCRRCTLAVAQHCPSPTKLRLLTKCTRTFNFQEIFKCVFKIYGIWPQASIDTHTLPQCSPASVGLAQAHSNDTKQSIYLAHAKALYTKIFKLQKLS